MIRSVALDRGLRGADIDEVIQDVRVRLWQAHRTRPEAEFTTSYIYRTAMSASLDFIRRQRRDRTTSLEAEDLGAALPDRSAGPEGDVLHGELTEALGDALDRLAPDVRVAVRMYLVGYPRRDIARILGWSDGRTRNALHRALTRVRTFVTERGLTKDDV